MEKRRKSTQSVKANNCRRLSQISTHSIVIAVELQKDKQRLHSIGGSDDSSNSSINKLSFVTKCFYTFIMLMIHFNFGLSLSGFAPSFVDFKHLLNTSMSYISLMPTFQAIGCMSGSLCGTLYKYVNRQLILICVVIGMGLATVIMPYSTELWHIYLCIFVYGFGIGAWNNSNNVWLMEMWQANSPSVLQFSQSIYGVGTVIGPLVVRPFLTGEFETQFEDLRNSNSTSNITDTIDSSYISAQLKTPFLITGCIQMIGPCLMFIIFWIRRYEYTPEIVEDEEETISTDIPKKTLIFLVSIFFAFGFMTENMYMDFAPTYFQFIPLRLSAPKAAEIASTMAIALAGGRALCVFVAMKVRPQYMIATHVCIIWIGIIIQYFGESTLGVLWFSSVLICYGYSCIYVALFAFVNQYFELTDKVGTIFILSYNSIYLFLPFFLGSFIETIPSIFALLLFICVSVSIIDFGIILIIVRKIPNKLLRL